MEIRVAKEEDIPKIFSLRTEVFVEEQNVPIEIELDAEDELAVHIIAENDGEAIGCGRIIFSDKDAHIGRLAVKKSFRCKGIGSKICSFIIENCLNKGYKCIRLNAQLHAVEFYKKLGFKPKGEIFTEAGIEHIEMEVVK